MLGREEERQVVEERDGWPILFWPSRRLYVCRLLTARLGSHGIMTEIRVADRKKVGNLWASPVLMPRRWMVKMLLFAGPNKSAGAFAIQGLSLQTMHWPEQTYFLVIRAEKSIDRWNCNNGWVRLLAWNYRCWTVDKNLVPVDVYFLVNNAL